MMYDSPKVKDTERRRSTRLQLRSPGVNKLDLLMDVADTSSPASSSVERQHNLGTKRRRSLRLQEKQSTTQTPTKQSPAKASVSSKARRSSKKKRRQSGYFGKAGTSPPLTQLEIELDHVPAVSTDGETMQISLMPDGLAELVLALEQITSNILFTIEAMDVDVSDELDGEKENILKGKIMKRRKKGRRDTFDLSRKRGLRVGPSMLEVSCTPDVQESKKLNCDDDDDEELPCQKKAKTEFSAGLSRGAGCTIDSAMVHNDEASSLKKKLFLPTPKYSEVKMDVIASEITSTLQDDPCPENVEVSPEKKSRMEELMSLDVEEKMKMLFAEFKCYNYVSDSGAHLLNSYHNLTTMFFLIFDQQPCVSARIFSAMSLIFNSNEDFDQLFPLILSLVNAEIVSLKNKDESNDVYFINKRVCFSGYDYSSTMPAVDSIDGSHVDLVSSIEALEMVLKEACKLPRPLHYLDLAIRCLDSMSSCDHVSDVCSKTLVGYFPSSRFRKAIKHYSNELKDIRSYLTGQEDAAIEHIGVRFRLGDFIGRSVRFHLRKLLNSIPESIVDFFVEGCEDRWGRAVDDRSISSILNFSLDKVGQFLDASPQLFNDHELLPTFFSKEASLSVLSCGNKRPHKTLKQMEENELGEIVEDMEDARSFLLGARACKFVWELLRWPGVHEYIESQGGWGPVESIAKVFYDLKLYENSDNRHFILLRNVEDLVQMLEKAVEHFEDSIDACQTAIRKLHRQMIARQRDHSYRNKGTLMFALRMSLEAEKNEMFPVPVANYSC
jgi:hypothetical protein